MAHDHSISPHRLRGKLLLADPSLRHSTFNKSVIVINEHRAEHGAMGLILNHPIGKVVGDFLKDPSFAPLRQLAVHDGGPVDAHQLTFSSFWWNPNEGLCWAVHIPAEQAVVHARQPGRIVRAFVGYSGWTAGQLENELELGSWFPVDPKPELLGMAHEMELWHTLLSGISPIHRLIADAPDNPLLN